MMLMDDLDSEYHAKATTLIDDGGWKIKVLEGYTMKKDIKRYYITHEHKGYGWPIVKSNIYNDEWPMYQSVTCAHCNARVPDTTLGFLALLKWER